ncbi:hypothetical protein [Glutamicibacter sp.]|uniref:hypothetical protein n=1 Tax=Glutamicibacter sp. TaxID=1931995 RepID=UPI002FE2E1E1
MSNDDLTSRVEKLLFAADPIGINFDTNTDEYSPEAKSIVRRLPEVGSMDDLQRIIHQEFVHWFDADIAGSVEQYRSIAESIWNLWEKRENPPPN